MGQAHVHTVLQCLWFPRETWGRSSFLGPLISREETWELGHQGSSLTLTCPSPTKAAHRVLSLDSLPRQPQSGYIQSSLVWAWLCPGPCLKPRMVLHSLLLPASCSPHGRAGHSSRFCGWPLSASDPCAFVYFWSGHPSLHFQFPSPGGLRDPGSVPAPLQDSALMGDPALWCGLGAGVPSSLGVAQGSVEHPRQTQMLLTLGPTTYSLVPPSTLISS